MADQPYRRPDAAPAAAPQKPDAGALEDLAPATDAQVSGGSITQTRAEISATFARNARA